MNQFARSARELSQSLTGELRTGLKSREEAIKERTQRILGLEATKQHPLQAMEKAAEKRDGRLQAAEKAFRKKGLWRNYRWLSTLLHGMTHGRPTIPNGSTLVSRKSVAVRRLFVQDQHRQRERSPIILKLDPLGSFLPQKFAIATMGQLVVATIDFGHAVAVETAKSDRFK